MGYPLHLPPERTAGLVTGALTNTLRWQRLGKGFASGAVTTDSRRTASSGWPTSRWLLTALPIHLHTCLSAIITRFGRGDVDIVPTPDTRLEFGDRARVLTRRANFPAVSQFFGDPIKGTAETDFGSVAIGSTRPVNPSFSRESRD